MGQGYSLTTLSAGSAGIDVPEMADLTYEKSLGNARFMKCIRARHRDGLVIAKVVMKPYSTLRLDKYIRGILAERKALSDIPNALGYHRVVETGTNGYLVRQYIHSSLYDRMSTRPFLEDIEKKWLAFQLLCAVRDCHAKNIHHGDIKTENILVTSWNWLYLTDFSSSFKPTYLPEDNPADFSFFFDTSGRRTCYVAPERFSGEEATGKPPINWAMDIFSVGCVIAELFLERPIFTLSQLFKYRLDKQYDPEKTVLNNIVDKDIREMVAHMIQVDPQNRYSALDCLNVYKGKAFPEYFYSFLHDYMHLITDPTSGQQELTAGEKNLGEADDRIERVYTDFDKISFALGYGPNVKIKPPLRIGPDNQLFPLQVDISNSRHEASALTKPSDDGSLIFLTIVVGCLRSTARASARVKACELMLAFSERLTDEAKLDRILPYLMTMLHDPVDGVKVAALRTVTQLLSLVTVVSPTNSYVFPEFLLPRFQQFVSTSNEKSSPWVRSTYAMCLGTLASTAGRFLDMKQALQSGGAIPTSDPEAEEGTISRSMYQNLFDLARDDLVAQFEAHTKALLTDADASVRRALLPSVGRLCVFFGSQKASDVVLSHLNTYLNDRDWLLKNAFFETIVGVATYVGTAGLEEFILPLMIQALTDPEESVVESVIRSFSSIAQLGLFQRATLWELLEIVSRFTMHPNQWIREAAAQFISTTAIYASLTDHFSIIIPLIKVYLKALPPNLEELTLLNHLKPPLSRIVLELSTTWAKKSDKTAFWKNLHKQRLSSFGFGDNIPSTPQKNPKVPTFATMSKTPEDEAWIQRLRNTGLTVEDDVKLLALQEFIWRSTHRKAQVDPNSPPNKFNSIVRLKDLGVNLQNVFFDNDLAAKQAYEFDKERANLPRTIAEAIEDATSTSTALAGRSGQSPVIDTARTKPRDIPGGSNPQYPSEQELLSPTTKLQLNASKQPSSLDSKRSLRVTDQTIHRKGSVMSLMRDAGGKAAPEISTDVTNAFGQVERTHTQEEGLGQTTSTPISQRRIEVAGRQMTPVHSYTGGDPSILHLLDSLYLDSYPVGLLEFGQLVTPAKGEPLKRAGTMAPPGTWRPDGVLVAMLSEHTAAINRVVAAPDHKFFITASDDGTVKVWDAGRLERNVTHRARRTYSHGSKVRVTSICFVENTYCFVSTGSDGSVHIVKVVSDEKNNMTEYSRLTLIRDYKLPDGEFATWSHHHQVDTASILILATNKSRVYGIELRTMEIVYMMQNPLHHGAPTCFCVDKRNHWLLLGTAQGALDLWDLRFKLRLKSWGFPGGLPIHRIHPPIMRGSKRYRVTVCGGAQGDIITVDLERGNIKEVFRTSISTARESSLKNVPVVPALVDLEDDQNRAGGMLTRFATSSLMESTQPSSDKSVRAIFVGTHAQQEGSAADSKHTFVLSGGPDWKVRFWDTARTDACMVVHGLDFDEIRPSYTATSVSDALVISEKAAPPVTASAEMRMEQGGTPSGTPSKKSKGRAGGIVSLQQQNMLRGHKDMIMDLAILEAPYGMVVSVDRAGVAYVYS